MSRVGGPLIDVSALTAWERKKFYGVAARIRLAKGIHIRSADWHGLGRRERALASIVAAGVAAPTCIVAGKSAALIHGLPLPGWEDSHPVELAAHGVTGAGRTRGGVVHRHLSLRQSVAAEVVETGSVGAFIMDQRSNWASKAMALGSKSSRRTKAQASCAPWQRSMRESSHSTESGPW